jgi:O-antigen ligase
VSVAAVQRFVPRERVVDSFVVDAARFGLLALSGALVATGLGQYFFGGGILMRLSYASATLLVFFGVGILIAGVAVALAHGALRAELFLLGALSLFAVALTVQVLKGGDFFDKQIQLTAMILLAAAVGSAVRHEAAAAAVWALRLPVYLSACLIVLGASAAQSPLAERFVGTTDGFRFRGIFNHPVALSSAALVLFVIAVAGSHDRRLRIADVVASVTTTFFSDTRSGMVGIVLVVGLWLVLRVLRTRPKARATLLAVVPLSLFALQTGFSLYAAHRAQELLEVTSWRSVIWQSCWSSIPSHAVLGGDAELFAGGSTPQFLWWHCHNQTVSTLYVLGIPGACALGVLLLGLVKAALTRARTGDFVPWLLVSSFLWVGVFETPLGFSPDPQTLFYLLVVIVGITGGMPRTRARV